MAKLKFLKSSSKVKVKNFISNLKVLSKEIYMCYMKGLALTVQKLWPRLKFFKSSSKVKVKGHKVKNFVSNGKVLSEGICM